MTQITNPTEQALRELTQSFAETLGYKIDPKTNALTLQKAGCFFLYTKDGQAIAQFSNGDLFEVPFSYQLVNERQIRKIKQEVDAAIAEPTKLLRKYNIKYHVQATEETKDQSGMGEQYWHDKSIVVNPSQEWFVKNATKLVQAVRVAQRIQEAKSTLVSEGFSENARALKTLDAQTGNKLLGGLKTRWHRLFADPSQFQMAREILSKHEFTPREPAISALTLVA